MTTGGRRLRLESTGVLLESTLAQGSGTFDCPNCQWRIAIDFSMDSELGAKLLAMCERLSVVHSLMHTERDWLAAMSAALLGPPASPPESASPSTPRKRGRSSTAPEGPPTDPSGRSS